MANGWQPHWQTQWQTGWQTDSKLMHLHLHHSLSRRKGIGVGIQTKKGRKRECATAVNGIHRMNTHPERQTRGGEQ
jgi:hypothetical protein